MYNLRREILLELELEKREPRRGRLGAGRKGMGEVTERRGQDGERAVEKSGKNYPISRWRFFLILQRSSKSFFN